jgi:DeoR family transcriptional regulator, suf operon transcriptional repressor
VELAVQTPKKPPVDGASIRFAVRPVDQFVLELLRCQEGQTVSQLVEQLEVTPTAIRMRLDRLQGMGLIEKRKHGVGRGRPQFQYFLTTAGWRRVGVNYTDLARALWQEIESIDDPELKNRLMASLSRRMSEDYRASLSAGTLHEKLIEMAQLLRDRKISSEAGSKSELPVLTVHACPFPDLARVDQRSACELETEMLSQAVGERLELSCCRLDGHASCQFRPVAAVTV